eukprot:664872-Rhodomonas_salina.1
MGVVLGRSGKVSRGRRREGRTQEGREGSNCRRGRQGASTKSGGWEIGEQQGGSRVESRLTLPQRSNLSSPDVEEHEAGRRPDVEPWPWPEECHDQVEKRGRPGVSAVSPSLLGSLVKCNPLQSGKPEEGGCTPSWLSHTFTKRKESRHRTLCTFVQDLHPAPS